MAKTKELFVCDQCGGESLKWQGQCPACGAWNSLTRFNVGKGSARNAPLVSGNAVSKRIDEIGERDEPRISTGMGELDRVLGGGLVAGSVTLLGGDPGIGKSTLLLQVAAHVARSAPVLYASGEESVEQVGLRAARLGVSAGALGVVAASELEAIRSLT